LRPWQQDIVCGLFDAPRPRQGLVSIPRGNGKSTLAAALGLYGLFADGVEGAQVLCVASDERQARIVFNAARRMVELEPRLDDRCQIFQNKIYVPHTDSSLFTLPAEQAALQGYDPSLAVVDELGRGDARGVGVGVAGRRQARHVAGAGHLHPCRRHGLGHGRAGRARPDRG
jgi:phage terminase large subunit-like protein